MDVARRPAPAILEGRHVTLAGLDAGAHGDALWDGAGGSEHAALWSYLPDGPFPDRDGFIRVLDNKARSTERVYFAILDARTGRAIGHVALMRIESAHRVIEVGDVLYTDALQRTRGGTEAMFILARHVFEDLGYRRYEWKCNVLNEPSRRAALRYGFTFEGIFRQHMIVKGQSRDTAWYSMLDSEWPARKARLDAWLDDGNFDEDGRQRRALSSMPS
jgi:RimJ/RimL family protein N-acetyltransferase